MWSCNITRSFNFFNSPGEEYHKKTDKQEKEEELGLRHDKPFNYKYKQETIDPAM